MKYKTNDQILKYHDFKMKVFKMLGQWAFNWIFGIILIN